MPNSNPYERAVILLLRARRNDSHSPSESAEIRGILAEITVSPEPLPAIMLAPEYPPDQARATYELDLADSTSSD